MLVFMPDLRKTFTLVVHSQNKITMLLIDNGLDQITHMIKRHKWPYAVEKFYTPAVRAGGFQEILNL